MKSNYTNITLLAAVLLTLVLVGLYPLIPADSYSIVPSKWSAALITQDYAGQIPSAGTWVSKEGYKWRCDMDNATGKKHCGVNFFFSDNFTEGVDFSEFTHLVIQIKYAGPAKRVKLFFRNYNPVYSRLEDANSAKFMSLVINTPEFSQNAPVAIELQKIPVAAWWLGQRMLDRHYISPEFTRVSTIGFDFTQYVSDTESIEIEVSSVKFEGPRIEQEYWYLSIMMVWGLAILVYVAMKYLALKKDQLFHEAESKKYQELSNLDRLTGALNRVGVEKNLEELLSGQRSGGVGLAVIDIDHFKRVNDERGHDVGDEVLKTFVAIINRNIRTYDVFGRWGGEEFVLLVSDADNGTVDRVAEKIRIAIEAQIFEPDKPLSVTASFGLTFIKKDEQFDTAFKRADTALYEAKKSGRNCIVRAD